MVPKGISGEVERAGVVPAGSFAGGGGELYTCFDGWSQPTETNDNTSTADFQRIG